MKDVFTVTSDISRFSATLPHPHHYPSSPLSLQSAPLLSVSASVDPPLRVKMIKEDVTAESRVQEPKIPTKKERDHEM